MFSFFVFGTEASFSSRGWPPADPVGIRPPFVIKYVFVVVLSYTWGGRQPGRPDVCFPAAAVYLLKFVSL